MKALWADAKRRGVDLKGRPLRSAMKPARSSGSSRRPGPSGEARLRRLGSQNARHYGGGENDVDRALNV
jgi:hypothetical protein